MLSMDSMDSISSDNPSISNSQDILESNLQSELELSSRKEKRYNSDEVISSLNSQVESLKLSLGKVTKDLQAEQLSHLELKREYQTLLNSISSNEANKETQTRAEKKMLDTLTNELQVSLEKYQSLFEQNELQFREIHNLQRLLSKEQDKEHKTVDYDTKIQTLNDQIKALQAELHKAHKTIQEREMKDAKEKKPKAPKEIHSTLLFVEWKGKRVVENGTIDNLISYLKQGTDLDFMHAFILCHKVILSSEILLQIILDTWIEWNHPNNLHMGSGIPRLVNTLKYWLENFFSDFVESPQVMSGLGSFLDVKTSDNSPVDKFVELIQKTVKKQMDEHQVQVDKATLITSIPTTYTKKSKDKTPFILTIASMELANQITFVDHLHLQNIDLREFLNICRIGSVDREETPKIYSLLEWNSRVSSWVGTEILSISKSKVRIQILERIIEIASCLHQLNNFSGLYNVLNGLKPESIQRLEKTFKGISKKSRETLDKLYLIVSVESDYREYRANMSRVSPPLVPIPKVYTIDLIFLDSIGPTFMSQEDEEEEEESRINFLKLHRMALNIFELQSFQRMGYSVKYDSNVQYYLQSTHVFSIQEAKNASWDIENHI